MNKSAKMTVGYLVLLVVLVGILLATGVIAPPPPKQCNNGIDDDGDGAIDLADPGCKNNPNKNDETNCGDGVCTGNEDAGNCPADCAAPPTQCDDGTDNDGDTLTDYPNDPGCASANDDNELGTTACDDGSDNDGDSFTDYPDDPECDSPSENDETSCTDSDGGFVVNVQGTVSGTFGGNPFSETDFCVNLDVVKEYRCQGGQADNGTDYNCTGDANYTQCSNGACV